MVHYYERNIVEIKNEYTIFLINLITPMIYEGMKSMYNFSVDSYEKLIKTANDPKSVSPPLKIFQTCLKEVPTFNTQIIQKETQRIKEFSRCSEWFDDLVKATIKSNIVLLTFSTKKEQSAIVNDKYHERISTEDFIHKCYIETARSIYNNPELFWDEYDNLTIQKNQRKIIKIIKTSIITAIRKMLPMGKILNDFLNCDYPLVDNYSDEIRNTIYNYDPKFIYDNLNDNQKKCLKLFLDEDLKDKVNLPPYPYKNKSNSNSRSTSKSNSSYHSSYHSSSNSNSNSSSNSNENIKYVNAEISNNESNKNKNESNKNNNNKLSTSSTMSTGTDSSNDIKNSISSKNPYYSDEDNHFSQSDEEDDSRINNLLNNIQSTLLQPPKKNEKQDIQSRNSNNSSGSKKSTGSKKSKSSNKFTQDENDIKQFFEKYMTQ